MVYHIISTLNHYSIIYIILPLNQVDFGIIDVPTDILSVFTEWIFTVLFPFVIAILNVELLELFEINVEYTLLIGYNSVDNSPIMVPWE